MSSSQDPFQKYSIADEPEKELYSPFLNEALLTDGEADEEWEMRLMELQNPFLESFEEGYETLAELELENSEGFLNEFEEEFYEEEEENLVDAEDFLKPSFPGSREVEEARTKAINALNTAYLRVRNVLNNWSSSLAEPEVRAALANFFPGQKNQTKKFLNLLNRRIVIAKRCISDIPVIELRYINSHTNRLPAIIKAAFVTKIPATAYPHPRPNSIVLLPNWYEEPDYRPTILIHEAFHVCFLFVRGHKKATRKSNSAISRKNAYCYQAFVSELAGIPIKPFAINNCRTLEDNPEANEEIYTPFVGSESYSDSLDDFEEGFETLNELELEDYREFIDKFDEEKFDEEENLDSYLLEEETLEDEESELSDYEMDEEEFEEDETFDHYLMEEETLEDESLYEPDEEELFDENEEELEDEEFYDVLMELDEKEISQSKLKRAVILNRRYSRKLGWKKYRNNIAILLAADLFSLPAITEEGLAKAVARWQKMKGIKADGIIGFNTWSLLQTRLSISCPATYKPGEVKKSRTSKGHLDYDVSLYDSGKLLIADFGVNWGSVKKSTQKEKLLQEWLTTFKTDPSYRLKIIGYSDCIGKEKNNKLLRSRRAKKVYQLLRNNGVSRLQITYVSSASLGKYIVKNSSINSRAKNRGVIIKFQKSYGDLPSKPSVSKSKKEFWELIYPLVIEKMPLPSSLEPEFSQAVKDLKSLLKAQWKYGYPIPLLAVPSILCYLNKVLETDVDDRMIFWKDICGVIGLGYDPNIFAPDTGCLIRYENELLKYIKTKRDVEKANEMVSIPGFIRHLKVELLYVHSIYRDGGFGEKGTLNNLYRIHQRIVRTTKKLNVLRLALESRMPRHYRAIKDWIIERQKSSNSIYSCRE